MLRQVTGRRIVLAAVTTTIGAVALPVRADWPMLGHDAARSGATSTEIRPPFARKWYRAFPDEGLMTGVQPVTDGDRVYIGTLRGVLHAIDAESGEDAWTYQCGGPILHTAAVANDRAYVGCGDGRLYCLDAQTGERLWTAQTAAAIWNAPVVHANLVAIGSRDGYLHAFTADEGECLWQAPTGGPIVSSPAIDAATNRIYVGSEDMHVYAFDLATGERAWRSEQLPGVSFRGYHPVIAPDGSVLITVTPCAGGDAMQRILLDMVRDIFGDMASWRHTKEENERLRAMNLEQLEAPETYRRQLAWLREKLTDEPALQTFFAFEPESGRQKFVAPIVYAESMNGTAAPPVVTPDGKVVVKFSALLRSRYGQYSPFLNVGYFDTRTGHVEPIMDQSREYGWYDGLLLVHDEQCQLMVAGNTLVNTHQDNVNALDLSTLVGTSQPWCWNVHEVQPGVAASLWSIYLSGEPLPMGWEWFPRGTAVYGGGSVLGVPIVVSGDSFYYLPTHEINAGVVLLAYRMDPSGRATHRAEKPQAELTADQWSDVRERKWDWDMLEMPRLKHALHGLPHAVEGTRQTPNTEQAQQHVHEITDDELDQIIWDESHTLHSAEPSDDTGDVREKLHAAVAELLSQHWRPLLFPAGKHPVEAYYLFVDPSETLYTLALAYPHLSEDLQQKARARAAELLGPGGHLNPNEAAPNYDVSAGAIRSAYDAAPGELLQVRPDLVRDGLARLYPLWLWSRVTEGDERLNVTWPAVRDRTLEAAQQVSERESTGAPDCGNARLAGLIAACRLARAASDDEALARLLPATREAIRERLVYELSHTQGGLITQVPTLRTIFGRWRNLTPDVARLLREYAVDVHERLMDVYVDHHRPAWWLAWGPELLWRNETPFAFPTMSLEIFTARGLMLHESPERLTRYVDIPWCRGDEYYIQKLAILLSGRAAHDTTSDN